ncbi:MULTISPECIES: CBO0543 family protein [unclassified Bacillus (in: firmicutes)]|uniref:CBO0543 family protein n=1 Tax=unclassified Bacillus (in: firmicutes) TaxID=185979 RepID=UPI000BEF78F2|nr:MULTISPECIES: CBO0543 family protein [unclassified Bacillus (in: firmicutes)]PEJ48135.1 hypothetical protein CN692_24365 [Bacillus sp. AFS002410]PEL00011.1 hypothetical protein CN601_22470 [Bacillus sp. AFS017336]
MLLYIIFGFILPWLIGVILLKKITKIMILFLPTSIATAFLINTWGFNYFWKLKFSYNELSLSAIPFDLGLYPILGCVFISSIYYKKLNVFSAILIFSTVTTLIEFWALKEGQVIYRNGWTIYWTSSGIVF